MCKIYIRVFENTSERHKDLNTNEKAQLVLRKIQHHKDVNTLQANLYLT